jgi:glycine betaine transporter
MLHLLKKPTLVFSLVFVFVFCLLAFVFPEQLRNWLKLATDKTLEEFGFYYLYFGFFVVIALLSISVSPYGKIRLGKPSDTVEYSLWAWITMLYSTGMGAGLLLRAVQEPVYYFVNPPVQTDYTQEHLALQYTFFHWGFTPWAFYGLFALVIAYFLYHLERPILSSSILEGKLKHKIVAISMDSITIISTILGVIAAVGLGSKQMLGGLNYLFEWGEHMSYLLIIILILSILATISAFSGLGKGIQLISKFNIGTTLLLLLFTFIQSDVLLILKNFAISFFHYVKDFVLMSLNLGEFKVSPDFLKDWTCFYWAFWLAWTPFTGVFIARISRGRTVREFILGTLFIPSFGTFIWFTVFASSAFEQIGEAKNYQHQFDSIYSAIFLFFNALDFSRLANYTTILLLFTFLVTSIDSAIFVLSMFSDEGKSNPPPNHRLLWGFLLGILTMAIVWIGQTSLLQSVSQLLIVFALPFSFIYLGMILIFFRKLWKHLK